jgi:hypothetical protein
VWSAPRARGSNTVQTPRQVHAGQPLTKQQFDLSFILEKPAEFGMLIRYMKDNEALKQYMAATCATLAVTAEEFQLYRQYTFDGSVPTTAELLVCRDTLNSMEQHIACAPALHACAAPHSTAWSSTFRAPLRCMHAPGCPR